MTKALGLCINANSAVPDTGEYAALGIGPGDWVRTAVQGPLSLLDPIVQGLPGGVNVMVSLNNECLEVRSDWLGWENACGLLAQRYGSRVKIVGCGNELDLWHLQPPVGAPDPKLIPAFAADLVKRASPILRSAGIKVAITSVASGSWFRYLQDAAALCIGYADYADLHLYMKRVNGVPNDPNWQQASEAFLQAHNASGLPVLCSEAGIKVDDAGGLDAQARWAAGLGGLPADLVSFWCWSDRMASPGEAGGQAFGARGLDGKRKPVWFALQQLFNGSNQPEVPTVPPTPEPRKPVVGASIAARMLEYATEPSTREMYHPTPEDWDYADAYGKDGRHYVYLKSERQVLVTDPTTWVSEDELLNPKPPVPALWPSAERVSDILGAPLANVRANWPLLHDALVGQGIGDRPTVIAALATVGVETSSFLPIEEYRNADGSIPAYWYNYGGGPLYHGRGLIQLTHDYNYKHYGDALGVDLLNNPALALDPAISARVFALYFKEHGIQALAEADRWTDIRRAINGGTNGLPRFLELVTALSAL